VRTTPSWSVRIEPAGALDDDQHEVELLRGAVDGWIAPGAAARFIAVDPIDSDADGFYRGFDSHCVLGQVCRIRDRHLFDRPVDEVSIVGDEATGPADTAVARWTAPADLVPPRPVASSGAVWNRLRTPLARVTSR
jgi:hypothetical protein